MKKSCNTRTLTPYSSRAREYVRGAGREQRNENSPESTRHLYFRVQSASPPSKPSCRQLWKLKLLTEDASQRYYSSLGNIIAKGRNGPESVGVWILSLSPIRTLLLAPSSRSFAFPTPKEFPQFVMEWSL